MNIDKKERWCEELRSGKYRQTTGRYMSTMPTGEHCFCTLGLLLHVFNLTPNISFLHEFNIPEIKRTEIIYLNDIRRFTFDEMATWIWENL